MEKIIKALKKTKITKELQMVSKQIKIYSILLVTDWQMEKKKRKSSQMDKKKKKTPIFHVGRVFDGSVWGNENSQKVLMAVWITLVFLEGNSQCI